MRRLAQELSQGLAHEVPTRPHYLLCMTWAGWAWATPLPLKCIPSAQRAGGLIVFSSRNISRDGACQDDPALFGVARGLVGQGRGWLGRGAQRGGQGGLWWHVARRDILEQSRLHRSSIYYPKIIKKFLWAYITEILQVQFYYKFRPNR